MVKKSLTHIYQNGQAGAVVAIGDFNSVSQKYIELFEKALVLTSDLKRLPFLLGGRLFFWYDAHIPISLVASTLAGVGFTAVLLNGNHVLPDTFLAMMGDRTLVDDLLLTCHGIITAQAAGAGYMIHVEDSHWDFEGEVPLFDSLTLGMFTDCDNNVASANFGAGLIRVHMEIEVDWKPFSAAELKEFLMEHIYAKQGD